MSVRVSVGVMSVGSEGVWICHKLSQTIPKGVLKMLQ